MKKRIKIKLQNSLDSLELFNSCILILLLIIVLIGSLQYGFDSIKQTHDLTGMIFILGIEIAIITTICQWIWGRTERILLMINKYKLKGGIK